MKDDTQDNYNVKSGVAASGTSGLDVGLPPAPTAPSIPEGVTLKWFYLVCDKTCGPSTTQEVRNLMQSGGIMNATYVFHEGMKDWTKAYSLPEFQGLEDSLGSGNTTAVLASLEPQPPSNTSHWALYRRHVFLFTALLVFVGAILGLAFLQRRQGEQQALLARQREEQAALQKSNMLKKWPVKPKKRQEQLNLRNSVSNKRKIFARRMSKGLEKSKDSVKIGGLRTLAQEKSIALGAIVQKDKHATFGTKVERIATWFREANLHLLKNELAEPVHFDNTA